MFSIDKKYQEIVGIFFSYLPSRLLVVLNSLIIVPVLAHIMSTQEISIFQLSIGILNLVCTCSTDWIAKSALRFYEKYNVCSRLDEFFSNIVCISITVYIVIFVGYFLFSGFLSDKLLISKPVLLMTVFLVIPAGFRQFLYQMLRVFNRPFLYTFSIVIYQIAMLALFLILSGVMQNVYAVLWAMIIAMFVIDMYILKEINFRAKISLSFDYNLLFESLIYALPQIITNLSIWAILNINKYIFQYEKLFDGTATVSVSYLFTAGILSPLLGTLSFAIFPMVIKEYENKNSIKLLMTHTVRIFSAFFIPIIALFCFYSKEISELAFSDKYPKAYIMIIFWAVVFFVHALMKLLNIKYHLKNKTYIEMAITLFSGLLAIWLNMILIPKFDILGAGIAMLVAISVLFILNLMVQFKDMNYISFKRSFKTLFISVGISAISFGFIELIFIPNIFAFSVILKMVMFLFFSYLLSLVFVKQLLK